MEEWRRLREEQDREFAESLAADLRRSEAATRESLRREEAAEEAAAREILRREEAAEEAAARRAEASARATEARARLQPEPAQGEAGLRLSVRLPSGRRLQRRFAVDEAVSTVYDFVDVAMHEEGTTLDGYELVAAAAPAATLSDRRQLLRTSKLVDGEALLLRLL